MPSARWARRSIRSNFSAFQLSFPRDSENLVRSDAVLIGATVLIVGCQDRLCYDAGMDPNGRYAATIIEIYNAQSSFTYDPKLNKGSGGAVSCAGIDGLAAQAMVEFQGTGTVDDLSRTCQLIAADLTSRPSEIMPGDGSAQREAMFAANQVDDGLIHASQQVTIAGCPGGYGLEVYYGGTALPFSHVFDTPVPGDLPPALLHRIFVPVATSTCATNCEDNFVIQFSKE
jgi:hypothetical protein